VLAAGTSALTSSPAWAQARLPLLLDGKKTLYQRVLTRPGAAIASKPGEAAGKPLEPFSVFFVYEQVQAAGKGWLLVGAASDGKTQGFLPETDTVPWRHMITLAFASPTTRERVLFFRERAGLTDFINGQDPAADATRLLREITAKGTLGATHPVIAAEPDKYIDMQKSFYLLPVLESASTLLKSGHRARVVKVASLTRDTQPAPSGAQQDAGIENFNAAVVFVIDATSSMQPYIDRTRSAMEEVLKAAEAGKMNDRIRFGLVAFQDDPKKAKGMDYLSKVFADPNQVTTREQFMAATQGVKAAASSTRAYAEDAYAGIDDALRRINWSRFGGRYIVYITDASAREGNSPYASTGLATQQMRTQAQERGVAIYAMHLRTPEGKADHSIAEAQFKRLTDWPGRGPLYFPVEAGDQAHFEADVKNMARTLVDQVAKPQRLIKPGGEATADPLKQSVDAVGRAMVLAYLGRQQGVASPAMFESWAMDRDVRNRELPSFTVRVLLTKNQLSDLQATVRRLSDAYEKSQLDPTNFFNQLRSAAAAMGRDPSRLGQGQVRNLEQAGLMAEYLEGLPYQSPLMSMNFDTWKNMSVGQQQAVVDNLKSLVALYQRFHDDVDRWVKLNPAAGDGDRVFPVPIDSLP
jgi:hypothetical protein